MIARLLSLSLVASVAANPSLMQLHLMHDKGLNTSTGAVCLDGSDAGFYFLPSPTKSKKGWQLHFKGDGWCYDAQDCLARSEMTFGTSTKWPSNTTGWNGGILSPNCDSNSDFCDFNKVILLNCDGTSFSGDLDAPLMVPKQQSRNGPVVQTPIYFRGKRVLDAIMETLLTDEFGMKEAEEVLVTGCSSGGLAAYLHADRVHDILANAQAKEVTKQLQQPQQRGAAAALHSNGNAHVIAPDVDSSVSTSTGADPHNAAPLKKFKTIGMSGFFLLHDNVLGDPIYQTQMKNVFEISNSSGGVDHTGCVSSMPEGEGWRCMFAQEAYARTKLHTFVENSNVDAFQLSCIFTAALPDGFPNQTHGGNGNCNGVPGYARPLSNCSDYGHSTALWCNDTQIAAINGFGADYVTALKSAGGGGGNTATYSKPGNGAFIHSCHTHCEGISGGWSGMSIGGVTMHQAVAGWWQSDGTDPSDKHSYLPCTYTPHANANGSHACNPSCGDSHR